MARDQVLLPAASLACKAPARPKGSAGEMGSSRAALQLELRAASSSFRYRVKEACACLGEADRSDSRYHRAICVSFGFAAPARPPAS